MKKILILLTLFIFIAGIQAVSADADNANQTFDDIQVKIDNANDKDIIQLDGNYTGDKEISISKSLTIQGSSQNTVLDGKSISRAFNVKKGDVTFKNLNFINCISEKGGAVYSSGSVIFINCNFIDNHASSGGAIYAKGNLKVSNCQFTNNTAGDGGGAIYSYVKTHKTASKSFPGNVAITDSSFISNYAGKGGSAITFDNENLIKDSKYANMNIENCKFLKNTGDKYGSIFIVSSNGANKITVKKSKFIENDAEEGSAILLSTGSIYIYDCDFEKNTAVYGAVDIEFANEAVIKNSNFNKNKADTVSAIKSYLSTMTITDCKFKDNSLGAVGSDEDSKLTIKNNNKKTVYSKVTVLDNSLKSVTPIKAVADNLVSSYDSGDKFIITLKNIYNSKPVKYFDFTVVCKNGKKTKTFRIDSGINGKGKVNLNRYFSAGKYKVTFKSDDWSPIKYSSVTITIKKAKTIVKAPKVTVKYKKSMHFKAKITNKKTKKPLEFIKVKIKVYTGKHAKTYIKKTSEKGVVKINTKKLSKGLHKVVVKSANDNYIIHKTSKIIIK